MNSPSPQHFDINGFGIQQSGTFLIEASAGTGKTFNIQHLYLRLILERQLRPREILVVTFTEAATAELRDRIRTNLDKAMRQLENPDPGDKILHDLLRPGIDTEAKRRRLRQAQLALDEAAIYTIHGFCSRMLRDFAFEANADPTAELVENDDDLVEEIVQDFWRRSFYGADPETAQRQQIASAQGITLERLLGLARNTHAEEIRLVPEPAACRPVTAILADISACLAGDVDGIRGLLLADTSTSTNKENGLPKSKIETDFAQFQKDPENLSLTILATYGKRRLDDLVTPAKKAKGLRAPEHPFFTLCDELGEAMQQTLLAIQYDCVRQVRERLPALKGLRKIQTYDDLIMKIHAAVKDGDASPLVTAVRLRYKAALVDEFQDTDPHQFAIFNTIFGGTAADHLFFMIGDPKQSIYKFRGADIGAYLAVKRKVEPRRQFTLSENFRSSPDFLEAVNALYAPGEFANPFVEPDIPYLAVTCGKPQENQPPIGIVPLQFRHCQNARNKGDAEQAIRGDVANQIGQLLAPDAGSPAWQPGQIAVLVRSNAQAEAIQGELRRWRIPAVIYKAGNIFDSAEARQLLLIFTAILEPNYAALVRGALATPLIGFSLAELAQMVNSGTDTPQGTAAGLDASDFCQRFAEFRSLWIERGFATAANTLLHQPWETARGQAILLNLASGPEANRRLANLRQLIDLLQERQMAHNLSPESLLRWFGTQVNDRERREADSDAYEMRLETDADAVTIMTVHKSKGLEFPVVFCPFLWEPKINPGKLEEESQRLQVDNQVSLTEDAYRQLLPEYHRQALAEDLRILYVAVTRAKFACIIHTCEPLGSRSPTKMEHSALNCVLARNTQTGADGLPAGAPTSASRLAGSLISHTAIGEETASRRYDPEAATTASLVPPPASPPIEKHWGILSFSAMRGSVQETGAGAAELSTRSEGGGDDEPASRQEISTDQGRGLLAPLPGGKQLGTCVHEIFEVLDFPQFTIPEPGDGSPASQAIAESLGRNGLLRGIPRGDWQNPVARNRFNAIATMLEKTLAARLPDAFAAGKKPLRLGTIAKDATLAEMVFDFELPENQIGLETLAAPLRAAGKSHPAYQPQRHQATVEGFSLGFKGPSFGFMTGSIDLVFEQAGRYYFVDWKTNLLETYDQPALLEKMFESGYILQLYIYATALDRFLRANLPGYDFDRHFGGGYYLFVRGIDAGGVFVHRPTAEALKAFRRGLKTPDQPSIFPQRR